MNNNRIAFIVVTSLFFIWGFITCMNDILIPFVKAVFNLSRTQSMYIQLAFFGAYFIGSLLYFISSATIGDPIQKIGYKKGIIIGLLISAIGCFMLYPAADLKIYSLFLLALFILGIGFTILQIAANPYVSILGKTETASSRLNLSQGFNSLGYTIAPILGGYLVFNYFAKIGKPILNSLGEPVTMSNGEIISAASVQIPYLIFGGIFILIAIIFALTKLPEYKSEKIEFGFGILKNKNLLFGMLAIFFYVGGEVSIGSILINFLEELVGFNEMQAKSYLSIYWGGLMIGRFLGAYTLGISKIRFTDIIKMFGISILAFAVIYFSIFVESGESLLLFLPFIGFIILNILIFVLGKTNSAKTLMLFSLTAITILIATMLSKGELAMWFIISIGLFNSIMWSNIFTITIKGLGNYTSQASSLLVMMILGGAVLPPVTGMFADAIDGYHYALIIPMLSYVYLAFYGKRAMKN